MWRRILGAGLALVVAVVADACTLHADLGAGSLYPSAVVVRPPPPAATVAVAPAPPRGPNEAPVPPPASLPAGQGPYLGCYIDANDRDLRDAWTGDDGMSLEVCAEHCRTRNSQYFAVQAGRWCSCGNSFGRYGAAQEAECGATCAGNQSQHCGGSWRNSVYRVSGVAVSSPEANLARSRGGSYLGCYIDAADRDLHDLWSGDDGMSLEVCASKCRVQNSQYFAVQAGRWCSCGNSFGRYGASQETECSATCAGNQSQHCGGSWRNSVYKVGASGVPAPPVAAPHRAGSAAASYLGCYIDANDRDLHDVWSGDDGMSLEVCAAKCRAQNSQYFGVQAGRWCSCGSTFGKYGQAPEKECGATCSGNQSQKCGGSWRNSVYRLR